MVAACVLVAATACFALFANLGDRSWQTDEPVYRNAAAAIAAGNLSHNLEHPPLGKYAFAASRAGAAFLGDADPSDLLPVATRLPSAIASLVTGVLLGLLAVRVVCTTYSQRSAAWAGIATFAAWTLLPHPDPSFDVTRLAYLDALMACGIAAAMYAAWRWQESWSWRWAVLAGVAGGAAVATKLPAAYLPVALLVLVVARDDASRRRRGVQLAALGAIGALVFTLTYIPMRGEAPEAWRFMAAMQARDLDPTFHIAGRTYEGRAPWWTQAWWQWDAWPAMAVAQLAVVAAAWWLVRRRAAVFLVCCTVLPAVVFATGAGRILPHWQVAWQPPVAVLLGAGMVGLTSHRRRLLRPLGVALLAVVAVTAGVRTVDVLREQPTVLREAESVLAAADQPDAIVVDASRHRIERSLVEARAAGGNVVYHSAAESQHRWFARTGGAPLEPDIADVRSGAASGERVAAIVVDAPADVSRRGFGGGSGATLDRDQYRAVEAGDLVVWLRRDL